jgi:D-tyrosyl-tRNA(Tyr) deacylase
MKTVVQRVSRAFVEVDGEKVGQIGRGLLVLAAFKAGDNDDVLRWMAKKISTLRIFEDDDGKMNLELVEVDGGILVVSQFTLYGDCRKGKRPSFVESAPPDVADERYNRFVEILREETRCDVQTGVFQAHMNVVLENDGPVTVLIEKESE